jgi:mRNA interferase HigB
MRVIKPKTVREYAEQYPDAHGPLLLWLRAARAADWNDLLEVRKTYPHADAVRVASGNIVTVFNLRGNRYRLIVAIKYEWAMVYVLRFLTHADYNKDKWKEQL